MAPHPNLAAVVLADGNPAVTGNAGALVGHVGCLQMALLNQPLRQAAVEAARHRVFHPGGGEGAHFKLCGCGRCPWAQAGGKSLGFTAGAANQRGGIALLIDGSNAHLVAQRLEMPQIRLQRQHRIRAVQQQAQPVRAIVQISGIQHMV